MSQEYQQISLSEFIKMQESMIQNLKSDNDSLRQRNTDLENALKKLETRTGS